MWQSGLRRLTGSPMARSHLQQLATYVRPYQNKLWLGIGALLLVNAMSVFLPWYLKGAIDSLDGATLGESGGQVLAFGLTVLLVASLMMVIRTLSRLWMFGVGRQVEFDLKQRLFEHLLTLPPSYYGNQSTGDLITRATSDVDNIRRLLGFAILSLANTLFAYALTVPAMFAISVSLSTLVLMVFPLMLVLVKVTSGKLQQQQAYVQESLGSLSDLIQEDMNGITLIKVYAQEANEQREFAQRNRRLLNANLDLAMTRNWLFPTLTALVSMSFLVLLLLGGSQIAQGQLTIGEFSALTLYVERLVFPTALLGFTITAYQRGQVSLDRIEAILHTAPTIADPAHPLTPIESRGSIQAVNLSFAYPQTSRLVLDQVSFRIEPGQMVALVGPVGSGKTTLANAIPRLLEIKPEQLYVDGTDVTQCALDDLRRRIAYVPQESFLFSATIADNIRYGRPDVSLAEVQRVAQLARLEQEIEIFPLGYQTLVGERGITLSGGQRQRTALARALLIESPILILDDAISSVDNETAQAILENLRQGSRTVLFISHRLTAIVGADQILVMDQGRIVQQGSHETLLRDPQGLYARLWDEQHLEGSLAL
ncbi:MAG: ABC transporter ATP-binding protein [Synechococcales cyanobacterium]